MDIKEYQQKYTSNPGMTRKMEWQIKRKEKYGYPKKCPAINKIQSTIIFSI